MRRSQIDLYCLIYIITLPANHMTMTLQVVQSRMLDSLSRFTGSDPDGLWKTTHTPFVFRLSDASMNAAHTRDAPSFLCSLVSECSRFLKLEPKVKFCTKT